MIRTILALSVLGVAAEARAATGLAWQWPDTGWRHHVVARVITPVPLLLMSEFNAQVRVYDVQIDAIVNCVPTFRGKRSTDVNCTFDDLAIQIRPITQDEDAPWQAVVEELDQRWSKAHTQLTLGADGQLKRFDVSGVDQADPRLRENFQTMRLLMGRVFAAYDLGLPPKGDEQGKGVWTQPSTAVTSLLSLTGSFGQVRVAHQLTGMAGPVASISSMGKGVITSDPSAAAINYFDTFFRGEATFDTARGVMLDRQYLSRGEPTASSALVQGNFGMDYLQMGRLTLLEADAPRPVLPPSGHLAPAE